MIMEELGRLIGRLAGKDRAAIPRSLPLPLDAEVRVLRRMRSKKNVVYLVGLDSIEIIAKVFRTDGLENELFHLTACLEKEIRVPQPFGDVGRVLVMEYLHGNNVCDLINETPNIQIGTLLAEWFAAFHSSFGTGRMTTVKSDAKLRNMIDVQGRVYGLDFEAAHRGDLIEDLGEICSQILNTDPAFIDRKYQICDEFLRSYQSLNNVSLSGIGRATAESMVNASRFRPQHRVALLRSSEELKKGIWPFDRYG